VLNNVTDVLSVVLSGTLGRSGRKRARRATSFLNGHRGFLSTSALIGAAGVAWGIYDTLKNQNEVAGVPAVPGVPGVPGVPSVNSQQFPPLPTALNAAFDPVARIIRLAVSAAKADGVLSEQERALILERAREAGLESVVEGELAQTRPLTDIVRGVTDPAMKRELYVLAFTIVRADETVSGAERIYLAQLAHPLGLDAAAAQAIESETATKIDSQTES
jgi:uncharacterized membrane protein YebE (DUF533 family)